MAQRRMIGDENPDVYDHAPVEPSLLSAADARLLRPEVFVAEQLPGDGALVVRRKDGKLQCQRRGCGQLYVEGDGAACFVHPGEPLSVGNVTAWSCCGAHDVSFAQLAALKGYVTCTRAASHCALTFPRLAAPQLRARPSHPGGQPSWRRGR